MKIRLFTIPNLLTLGNLLCGSAAAVLTLVHGNLTAAFWLIIVAVVCDFFDGFAARLLGQSSPMGVELDSLADMVTSGFAPAAIMMVMYADAGQWFDWSATAVSIGYFLPLSIAAFSALRLARFNIDDTQHTEFRCLPTPANALLCASLGMLSSAGLVDMPREAIVVFSLVMSYLLVCPVRMFSLKFSGFGWKGNGLRYVFIVLSLCMIIVDYKYSIAAIIVLYIAISIVRWLVTRNKSVD